MIHKTDSGELMSDPKRKNKYEPIYVIADKESGQAGIESSKLIDQLLSTEEKVTCLFTTDSDEGNIAQVLDELRTLPFLADKRVVLVKDADKFISDNREVLENYFDNPCPTGILILVVSSWASNTRLAKKLATVGKLISLSQPKSWQLPQNLVEYAKEKHGKNLPAKTVELLIDLAGDNIGHLYSEIDKLALFVGDEKNITDKHVESLVGNNRFFNAFNVIDAILEDQTAKAVERLRNMFEADKSAEYTVVGAFAYHFRRLFNAKAMQEKGIDNNTIINKLNVRGNKDGFFGQLRKMTLKQIGDKMQRLAEIDYEIKTGRTHAKVAIEQMVLKMASQKIKRSH